MHVANEQLRETYRTMLETAAPHPWRQLQVHVGGVVAVGFGAEWLVVLTHSGLGVIDVATGKTVAREPHSESPDPYPIYAKGIGPLAGQRIPLAGLWGGGLRTMSHDGWVVHRASPNWPNDCAVLCPPSAPDLEDSAKATMLAKDLDPPIRGFGFSDSGKTLVVANTELLLWYRG